MRLIFCSMIFVSMTAAQDGLTGKWDVTASPEKGAPIKLDATLKQDGKELTGTVNSMMGSGPVKNAVVGNPDITFQFMINKYQFEVTGVQDTETIKGTFTGPRMKGAFLAKRIPPPTIPAVEGVETGTLGAQYRIDIPKNHNGSLIVYCHGYAREPGKFEKDKEPAALVKGFLEMGYAVAQSGYSKGGWAVKEAMEETEALRKFFAGKYGKPKRTYITGHSMGGFLTLALAESFPESYDAGLQMCGPTGPALTFFQRRVFDTLAVYDYYFPGVIGSPVQITEALGDSDFTVRLQKEMTSYPDRLEAFQKWGGFQSDQEAASVTAFFAAIQKDLMERGGGNAFDNRNTIYQGSTNDVQLNRGIKRYAADAKATEYVRKYATLKGQPKIPILTLHTTYDPLVPSWTMNTYQEMMQANGSDANYVARFVARNGHCTFTPQEMTNAFKDLVAWKDSGKKPEGGEQK
ncbi:MAG: alpha/beta fold hydrolase [Candidatus Solibacter usitatus]|nr:alpha/beta fold hydrolase [Candidatus Solibacter usitatus]